MRALDAVVTDRAVQTTLRHHAYGTGIGTDRARLYRFFPSALPTACGLLRLGARQGLKALCSLPIQRARGEHAGTWRVCKPWSKARGRGHS